MDSVLQFDVRNCGRRYTTTNCLQYERDDIGRDKGEGIGSWSEVGQFLSICNDQASQAEIYGSRKENGANG
jgi:hypothetical protein